MYQPARGYGLLSFFVNCCPLHNHNLFEVPVACSKKRGAQLSLVLHVSRMKVLLFKTWDVAGKKLAHTALSATRDRTIQDVIISYFF